MLFHYEPASAAREDSREAGADDNGEAGVLAEVETVPDDGGVLAAVAVGVDVVAVAVVVGVAVGEVVVGVGVGVGVVDLVGVGVGVTLAGGGV